jgi:hypothetical protein
MTHVVPNLSQSVFLNQQVALLLAPPVLWAVFEDSMQYYMPTILRKRIQAAYNILEIGCQMDRILFRGFLTEVFPDNIDGWSH